MTAQELAQAAFDAFNRGDMAAALPLFEQLSNMAPDWVPAAYGLGMTLFQSGSYERAAAPLSRAVSAGIGLPESWRYWCHALAQAGQDAELVAALAYPEDPVRKAALAFQIFNNRVAQGRLDRVRGLNAALPDEPALRMAGAFWAGIASATDDDVESHRQFQSALSAAQNLRSTGIDSPLVASHILAGGGIETDAFVLDESDAAIAPQIDWLDPPSSAQNESVFFAAADGAYVDAFARDCIASLASLGAGRVFHLHIVDPGPETLSALEVARRDYPALVLYISTEQTDGMGDAVYYACARFLVLPSLLQRYRCPVVVIDIDCLFLPNAARLPFFEQEIADVAFCRVDTVFPWLRYPAAMVILQHSQAAVSFADCLARFLACKLAGPRSWTLDQAALFCVIRAVRRGRPDIVLAELNESIGLTLDDLVRSQGSFAEKRAMRLDTAGL